MTDDRAALRKTLRDTLREGRRQLPPATRIAAAESLSARLLTLPFAPGKGHVAGYWAMDGEIALHVWQMRLPPDVIYCLPVLGDDDLLRFAPWCPGEALAANRYGIPEPAEAEALPAEAMSMIVLPLVGFDPTGQRLGMGGGWYDRTLAFRRDAVAPPPWLVGVGFAMQKLDALPAEPWDVPLDAVCTESDTFDLHTTPT
jgi:5-formyltetrahydrofolate cyclo-ligase